MQVSEKEGNGSDDFPGICQQCNIPGNLNTVWLEMCHNNLFLNSPVKG